jgi:hypothetical protein
LQLSDEPLLEAMKAKLAANGYKLSALIETIVTSPQFMNKRALAYHPQRTSQKGNE